MGAFPINLGTFEVNRLGSKVISLEQTGIYPDWTDERSQISLTRMLQAKNGLDWEENYGGVSDATNMLFLKPDAA